MSSTQLEVPVSTTGNTNQDSSPNTSSTTSPTPPSVSVVVLSKDEPSLIDTLESLETQIKTNNAELIVVDASSNRLDYIAKQFPWVKWIAFTPPFWRSSTIPQQRNVGVCAANSDIIAFCDSGGIPEENWLTNLTSPILSGEFSYTCGPIHPLKKGVYEIINNVPDRAVVESPPTANVAFKKSLSQKIGGFNEALLYGSDLDFAWRAADAGVECHALSSAVMNIDWGPTSLTLRRSWRYGSAWARLFRIHPSHRIAMLKSSPERAAYPIWLLALIASFFLVRRRPLAPLAVLAALAIPLAKNRAHSPIRATTDHLIGAAAITSELITSSLSPTPPVVMYPNSTSPYTTHLINALNDAQVPTSCLPDPTPSQSINVLLFPLSLLRARISGAKILHIHWTFNATSPQLRALPLAPRLTRIWFISALRLAKRAGMRIIWTAHNTLPHDPVFDDDTRARRQLVSLCDAVIALSETSEQEVSSLFAPSQTELIPHGPFLLPKADSSINPKRENFLYFGSIHPYKGLDTLLAAIPLVTTPTSFTISGRSSPEYTPILKSTVTSLALPDNVKDISLDLRYVPDQDLANTLAASSFVVLPFSRVTNSGSAIMALMAGRPLIIPDLPDLAHLPSTAVIRYTPDSPVSLAAAIDRAAAMDESEYSSFALAASSYTPPSWSSIATRHAELYRSLFKKQA